MAESDRLFFRLDLVKGFFDSEMSVGFETQKMEVFNAA